MVTTEIINSRHNLFWFEVVRVYNQEKIVETLTQVRSMEEAENFKKEYDGL